VMTNLQGSFHNQAGIAFFLRLNMALTGRNGSQLEAYCSPDCVRFTAHPLTLPPPEVPQVAAPRVEKYRLCA